MKKKLSLNILLHNDKLMMGLSLVIAIVVWALVVNGPANVKTKTIRKDAAIDLTDTYAENNNIRVIETPPIWRWKSRSAGPGRSSTTWEARISPSRRKPTSSRRQVRRCSISRCPKPTRTPISKSPATPLHRYSTVRLLGYRGSAGAYGYILRTGRRPGYPAAGGAHAGQDLFPKQYGQAGRAACHGEPDHVHCREGRGG